MKASPRVTLQSLHPLAPQADKGPARTCICCCPEAKQAKQGPLAASSVEGSLFCMSRIGREAQREADEMRKSAEEMQEQAPLLHNRGSEFSRRRVSKQGLLQESMLGLRFAPLC